MGWKKYSLNVSCGYYVHEEGRSLISLLGLCMIKAIRRIDQPILFLLENNLNL